MARYKLIPAPPVERGWSVPHLPIRLNRELLLRILLAYALF